MGVILRLGNVSYPSNTRGEWLLRSINLQAKSGELIAIYGPAGSGKSTLLEVITREKKPEQGWVERSSQLAVMAQTFDLYQDLTVMENLEFTALINGYSMKDLAQTMPLTGLLGWEKVRAGKLPAGLRKMLQLACALSRNFNLLVLDEPTVGMDTELQTMFWELVCGLTTTGKTVLFLTSLLAEAERCDPSYKLDQGRLKLLRDD